MGTSVRTNAHAASVTDRDFLDTRTIAHAVSQNAATKMTGNAPSVALAMSRDSSRPHSEAVNSAAASGGEESAAVSRLRMSGVSKKPSQVTLESMRSTNTATDTGTRSSAS